jgi:hypothetical protein
VEEDTYTVGAVAIVGMAKAGNAVLDWNTLLGAAVGALLVFLFTEVREYRQRRRELVGLLKVLRAELDYNDQKTAKANLLEVLVSRKEVGQTIPLSEDAWLECRTKVAQLADRKAFSELETYYRMLQEFKDFNPKMEESPWEGDVKRLKNALGAKIIELKNQADVIRSSM